MRKILYSFFFTIFVLIVSIIIYLSTVGLETSKFNNLITSEVKKKNPNIEISLDKVKIKFDIKKIEVYFSTFTPKIIYHNIEIPITEINIYSKISSILKSKNHINKATISIKNFNTKDIKKIAVRIKPSNFKTYLLNNLNDGKIEKILIKVKLDKDLNIIDYKVNGSVKEINVQVFKNFLIQNLNFNFISDKDLTLINSISANYQNISISNGSLSLKKNKEIEGKFNSKFNSSEGTLNKLFSTYNLTFLEKNKINVKSSLLHEFKLKINKNFLLDDYDYKSSGVISEAQIILKDVFKSSFFKKPVNKIVLSKTNLEINLSKNKNNNATANGFYNLGGSKNKKFKVSYDLSNKVPKYLIDFDLSRNFFFKLINFKTNQKTESNIKSEIYFTNNNIFFKNINFKEGKNLIYINDLLLNKKKEIESISDISVLTFNNNEENNNFKIFFNKKISIVGKKYDTTYLLNQLSGGKNKNLLKNFTKDIEIKLKNLITKSKIPLSDFYLLGRIKNGKFEKISAKSNFSKNEYLDISLKKDENNKKILEIYSDLPQALLADYKFFEGINGGKLLYTQVYDETGSASKIIIEDFKVVKAPTFATLLTLADLGGVADILSGAGITFDILEINLKEDSKVTTIEEILALGPSVSLHMDGYIAKKNGLISLSGTMVPARTLNNMISKIPIVGNILVGNKAGEGVFGVSFKMKGLPEKIKTTVNPVKTLTPRFITRALENIKKNN